MKKQSFSIFFTGTSSQCFYIAAPSISYRSRARPGISRTSREPPVTWRAFTPKIFLLFIVLSIKIRAMRPLYLTLFFTASDVLEGWGDFLLLKHSPQIQLYWSYKRNARKEGFVTLQAVEIWISEGSIFGGNVLQNICVFHIVYIMVTQSRLC